MGTSVIYIPMSPLMLILYDYIQILKDDLSKKQKLKTRFDKPNFYAFCAITCRISLPPSPQLDVGHVGVRIAVDLSVVNLKI